MNPQKAMTRRRDCYHLAYFRKIFWVIHLLKPGKELRQVCRSGVKMPANNHLALSKHIWLEGECTLRFWIFHIEQFVGQSAAKLSASDR
jgi:hypothetical protein